jgi:hypothetical protein
MTSIKPLVGPNLARPGINAVSKKRRVPRRARLIFANGASMARITITRKNGTTTQYFWSDTDSTPSSEKTVYKQTAEGVKRMRGVHFDASANRIVKH